MTISQMRVAITEVYPGPTWERKVANMPDDQVVAIYYEFLRQGRFHSRSKARLEKKQDSPFKPMVGVQLTIDDFLNI